MANPFLGVRIPPELEQAILARMKETGQSKSEIVISALRSYLGIMSCHERLDNVDQRLSALEKSVREALELMVLSRQHSVYHINHGLDCHSDM
jgi:predicted DNA-binding protein